MPRSTGRLVTDTEPVSGTDSTRPARKFLPGPAVLISPMRRRHLRGVMAIENATNPRPWTEALFLGELRMPTSRIYNVAMDPHRVLGYCGLMIITDEGHITNVAVDNSARRMGIAKRLIGRTIRQARERGVTSLTLEVRVSNKGAQELYRRFGFAPGGIRPRYYNEPTEDALIMWAHDVDAPAYEERLKEVNV